MSHRWDLPASRHPEAAACTWLQDGEGRFVGVEHGGTLHSVERGDLESFDPRRCSHCEEQAGWLPCVFEHCPLCGAPTTGFADGEEVVGDPHWPQLSLPAVALPVIEPSTKFVLPPGANFIFVRVPLRDRLVAIAGDTGGVWVYSRMDRQWRPLVSAPTGHPNVPCEMFGALSSGGVLVYPTAEGAVWIDTSPAGPARVEELKWQPMAAPALLDGRVLMPVWESGGQIKLASRRLDDAEWQIRNVAMSSRVQSADNPPASPGRQWLARPVVDKYQVHWLGSDCLLFCDNAGRAEWTCWPRGFVPVLGPPPLETPDGGFWQIGHARNEDEDPSWAFASVAVTGMSQCNPVSGPFFAAGRLCFRLDMRHIEPPWKEADDRRRPYRPIDQEHFIIPLAAIGTQAALVLVVGDATNMTSKVANGSECVGQLYLSRQPGLLESLPSDVVSLSSSQRLQAFAWDGRLFVYDSINGEVDSWPLEVSSSARANSGPNLSGAQHD